MMACTCAMAARKAGSLSTAPRAWATAVACAIILSMAALLTASLTLVPTSAACTMGVTRPFISKLVIC